MTSADPTTHSLPHLSLPFVKGCRSHPLTLHLAPMDGITDFTMRRLLTSLGEVDYCTTEFIRITDRLMPEHIFYSNAPELLQVREKSSSIHLRSHTEAGTPVLIQLLGSDPVAMSENAHRAAELGAYGIDLNFGCPAKTVNRHDGGAVLLKTPDRVFKVVEAVRRAVPATTPVTAKMRLGFENPDFVFDNARACESGGAQWLTLHCRTKIDMYTPPAKWEWLPQVREVLKIPLIANGDINSIDDLDRCHAVSGCTHFMIGRGALANPLLFQQLKVSHNSNSDLGSELETASDSRADSKNNWSFALKLLQELYLESQKNVSGHYAVAKTKQWLRYQKDVSPSALEIFNQIKVLHEPSQFEKVLFQI